jgi:hypothetical protein
MLLNRVITLHKVLQQWMLSFKKMWEMLHKMWEEMLQDP